MDEHLPKFDRRIQKAIDNSERARARPTYGLILEFDTVNNTAKVSIAGKGSSEISRILDNVPCPVDMGIQGQEPEPGRPCWIDFKDGSWTAPIVVAYFNHEFLKHDWSKRWYAGSGVPLYTLTM